MAALVECPGARGIVVYSAYFHHSEGLSERNLQILKLQGEHAEARHVLAIPRDVRQALALVLRQAGIVRGVRHLERDVSAARGGRGDASREASVCAIANRAGHGRFSADNVAVQARDSIVRTDDAPTVSSEKTVGFEGRDRPRSRARPLGGHTARRARPASRLSR